MDFSVIRNQLQPMLNQLKAFRDLEDFLAGAVEVQRLVGEYQSAAQKARLEKEAAAKEMAEAREATAREKAKLTRQVEKARQAAQEAADKLANDVAEIAKELALIREDLAAVKAEKAALITEAETRLEQLRQNAAAEEARFLQAQDKIAALKMAI